MKTITRFIKKILGYYESGYEYWVNVQDIKVPGELQKCKIEGKKWIYKMECYLHTDKSESKIMLDENFNLVGGYSSLKIAYLKGIRKVPVHFID